MPTQILMPALSPTMEEGTLAKWHVQKGDQVRSGDIIAEIETDKATMEVEAVDEGTIGEILVPEGAEHIAVNQPIALLLTDGEDEVRAASVEARPAAAPQDRGPTSHPVELKSRLEEVVPASPSKGEAPSNTNGQGNRTIASPLARRLAKQRGIDLNRLHGSGPRGRIVKRDIPLTVAAAAPAEVMPAQELDAVEEPEAQPEPRRGGLVPSRPGVPSGLSDEQVLALYELGSYELVPHDTMRRIIAERLTRAKQTIPHFYLGIDCELDAVLAARTRLNGMAPQDGPRSFKLSVNDFIIKALAMALQKVPRANASWTEQGLLLHRASDIAVAVALPGGGLHTPVVRNAELKSLSEISNEMRDLAQRARSKRLAPHEYQGGSTTLSNLGMYGIDRFDAVINPPQASILAVGKGEKRPVIRNDAVKIATMMSATLSVDHRVIDGALGAELLAGFKAFIEDPVTMLV